MVCSRGASSVQARIAEERSGGLGCPYIRVRCGTYIDPDTEIFAPMLSTITHRTSSRERRAIFQTGWAMRAAPPGRAYRTDSGTRHRRRPHESSTLFSRPRKPARTLRHQHTGARRTSRHRFPARASSFTLASKETRNTEFRGDSRWISSTFEFTAKSLPPPDSAPRANVRRGGEWNVGLMQCPSVGKTGGPHWAHHVYRPTVEFNTVASLFYPGAV